MIPLLNDYLLNNLRVRRAARAIAVVCFLLFFVTFAPAQDFSKYHSYDEMTAMLEDVVDRHRDIARLESIGKTLEGRDVWLVEIANTEGVPVGERPALFIGGNLEGDQVIGSELALYVIDSLLDRYGTDADVRDRIDNHVIYVAPRINPDAAELMFRSPAIGRKTNTKPYDGDNDGRVDEDGAEDLNNDGYVTAMRVLDPDGEYMVDPDSPSLLRRADPAKGERGVYKVYWEGVDNDGDGFINEDPPGGIDINRNFQHEYPYHTPDAGSHMVSEPESRALMDWIIEHRNVAMILTFGESDNLITAPDNRGGLSSDRLVDMLEFASASTDPASGVGLFARPSRGRRGFGRGGGGGRGGRGRGGGGGGPQRPAGRRPSTTVNTEDVAYFSAVSEKYVELTGIRQQPPVRSPQGAFFQYGYYQFGVPSFTTPGWGISSPQDAPAGRRGGRGGAGASADAPGSEAGTPGARGGRGRGGRGGPVAGAGQGAGGNGGGAVDAGMLAWMESQGVDGFVEWSSFDHPELGEVEIGGFKPYALANPPASGIAELGASHAEFVLYLSSIFSRVRIARTEVVDHGGGIYRITAEVENAGFLPTSMAHGVVSRAVRPTMVQLGVDPGAIISGNTKTNYFQALDGSGAREKFEWIINGDPGQRIELRVVAQKGGSDTAELVLGEGGGR